MKTTSNIDWVKITAYGIILLLTIILTTGSCSHPKPQTITVTVPKIIGSFKPQKPKVINSIDKEYINNPINDQLISENEKLKQDYEKSNDSLKKILFANAVKLSKFASTFENDTIKIDINGVVQGEVKEITPKYVIKERKVDVQVIPKETVFRLLGGLEIGNTTKFNAFTAKANLLFQNRKGNMLSVGYDTNKRICIGKTWSIFDLKR